MLSKLVVLVVLVFTSLGVVVSQDRMAQSPNFTGNWSLHSRNGIQVSSELATIVVTQTDSTIKIVEGTTKNGAQRTIERLYYADGRGEDNPTADGKRLHSKSAWKKRSLVTKFSIPPSFSYNNTYINDRVDEWTLSKDGKTLTHKSLFTSSAPTADAGKRTYDNTRSITPLQQQLRWQEIRTYRRL